MFAATGRGSRFLMNALVTIIRSHGDGCCGGDEIRVGGSGRSAFCEGS